LSSAMSTVATRTFPRVTGCLLEAILVSRTCAKTVRHPDDTRPSREGSP
jgi:hypothetical protein